MSSLPSEYEGAVRYIYKRVDDVELSIHVFQPKDREGQVPGIVFFHGGGWNGGTPSQFERHCRRLASLGMVAATVQYRLKQTHGTSPFECLMDAKSAIRWVRQHATELGIDADRLAVGGGSAGGHLAAATTFVPGFDDPADDQSVSTKAQALCLFNPVIVTTEEGFGAARLGDQAEAFSPAHHVSTGAPPAVVFHGTKDEVTPSANTEYFAAAMKDAGASCTVHWYEGMGHGFFNGGDAYEQTSAQMVSFLQEMGFARREAGQ